jgi:hypothetical protein
MFARMKTPGPFARLRASALCRRDVPIRTAKDVIGWWEARRVLFNLIVGSAGILTCIVVGVVALGDEILFDGDFGFPDPPLFALVGILLYALCANVCFTAGWLVELIVQKIWPVESDRFATLSLSFGLIFSVLLTLAPGIVIGAAGMFTLIDHARHIRH